MSPIDVLHHPISGGFVRRILTWLKKYPSLESDWLYEVMEYYSSTPGALEANMLMHHTAANSLFVVRPGQWGQGMDCVSVRIFSW